MKVCLFHRTPTPMQQSRDSSAQSITAFFMVLLFSHNVVS